MMSQTSPLHEQTSLFDFSARGKVELTGTETLSFLHNLCTNDIKGLAPGSGCEAFLTTAKGRLIAPLFVSRLRQGKGTTLLLDTAPGLGEKICQQLTRFRISEDVAITDRTRELALLHLCGPEAPVLVARALGLTPVELLPLHHLEIPSPSVQHERLLRRNDLLNLPGFDLFCPASEAGQIWSSLVQAGAIPTGLQAFEVLRVEAGLPLFGPDLDEDRFVMEIGRTQQAISFKKGCYLGQESIVMARDRGHVNRQFLGLRLSQALPIPAGTKVFHAGEEIGHVTSSATAPQPGRTLALAYLKRGVWQTPGSEVEIDLGGEKLAAVVSALPFA